MVYPPDSSFAKGFPDTIRTVCDQTSSLGMSASSLSLWAGSWTHVTPWRTRLVLTTTLGGIHSRTGILPVHMSSGTIAVRENNFGCLRNFFLWRRLSSLRIPENSPRLKEAIGKAPKSLLDFQIELSKQEFQVKILLDTARCARVEANERWPQEWATPRQLLLNDQGIGQASIPRGSILFRGVTCTCVSS